MNRTTAIAKCNPQAIPYDAPKVDNGNHQKEASYSEALGFVSSCPGVAALAHYSLMGDSTKSRRECAREIAKELGMFDVDLIEIEVEVWVNADYRLDDFGLQEYQARAIIKHLDDNRAARLGSDNANVGHLEWAYELIDGTPKSVIEKLPFIGRIQEVRQPVFRLLSVWQTEWMRALGECDKEGCDGC